MIHTQMSYSTDCLQPYIKPIHKVLNVVCKYFKNFLRHVRNEIRCFFFIILQVRSNWLVVDVYEIFSSLISVLLIEVYSITFNLVEFTFVLFSKYRLHFITHNRILSPHKLTKCTIKITVDFFKLIYF